MNRSVKWPMLVAASALLGACAVVPAPVGYYGGAATGNVPGPGYGGYESAQGGYEAAPGAQDGYYATPAPVYGPSNSGYYGATPYYYGTEPYYGGYAPSNVYPVYPSVGVTVPLIVDPPRTYVRPRPIIVAPDDYRRNDRRDDRRNDRRNDSRNDSRDARAPYRPDPRANVPYDRNRPNAARVYRNAPFAPRARDQAQQAPRRDSGSAPAAARTSPGTGARTERPPERQAAPRNDRARGGGGGGGGQSGVGGRTDGREGDQP